MFYSILLTVLCATMISAALPPRDVYSAVIDNARDEAVSCQIIYSPLSDKQVQAERFLLTREKPHIVAERVASMGTWEARATIEKIICGDLTLSAPFNGVTGPSTNWRFRVEANRIVSVGPHA